MEYLAWAILAVVAFYLFGRWTALTDIQTQLVAVTAERREIADALGKIDDMERKLREIHINAHQTRRKLGFDNNWASVRHIEQEIEMLQFELERLKKDAP
jgi:hypothetical protein